MIRNIALAIAIFLSTMVWAASPPTVSGKIPLIPNPQTAETATSVSWYIDSRLIITTTTAPFVYQWDSTTVVDGQHIITATAVNADGTSSTATTATVTTANNNPARIYYFAAAGNDALDCQSQATACQTLAKVQSITYHGGDTVLFHGGDTFEMTALLGFLAGGQSPVVGAVNVVSGGVGYPITISTYGGLPCDPIGLVITGCAFLTVAPTSTQNHGVLIYDITNITVQNLVINGSGLASTFLGAGIYLRNSSSQNAVNINITNNRVVDFETGILVTATAGSMTCTLADNHITGSSITSQTSDGISVNSNGALCHTIGNLVENIGGNGGNGGNASGSGIFYTINVFATPGATTVVNEFNVIRYVGGNNKSCGGPAGNWFANSKGVVLQFNEVEHVEPINYIGGCDFDGIDVDIGNEDDLVQYNYTHDNYGHGILMLTETYLYTWGPNTARYNISENDDLGDTAGTGGAVLCGASGTATEIYCYNNTIWIGKNGVAYANHSNIKTLANPLSVGTCPSLRGLIANNLLASNANASGDARFVNWGNPTCTTLQFKANAYWAPTGGRLVWQGGSTLYTSLAAWQAVAYGADTGATTANPLLVSGGIGGECFVTATQPAGPQPCPDGYMLGSGSPLFAVGYDVRQAPWSQNVGTQDYWGNAIPHSSGTGFNIGADGSAPH